MKLFRRLRSLFQKEKTEAEMRAEILHHLAEQTRRNEQAGMPLAEAYYAAERQFGNVASIQEQAREGRGWFWLEQSVADLRFAARVLAKQRVFTLIAVLTLSIGIGASSAILGVIRAHVLDPVPGHDEDRLIEVYGETVFGLERGFFTTSYYVGHQLKQMPEVFDKTAMFFPTATQVSDGDFFQTINGASVDGGFFDFLDTRPLLGRWLTEEDVRSATRENIVISYKWWQTRFGGDPDVIGRQIRVREDQEEMRTIIGVMPPEFRFPSSLTDYWQPLIVKASELAKPGSPNYRVFGRLAAGVTPKEAQAALDVLHARMTREFDSDPSISNIAKPSGRAVRSRPLMEFFVEAKVRRSVWVVAVAAGFVLLIVCTNLALLQFARGEARRAEIALRVALGAGRGRILRQLLIESLLLAAGGGVGGLLLAHWLRKLGDFLLPAAAPALQVAGIDGTAAAWTFGVAAVCGILFGFFPAWRAGDFQPGQVLKGASQNASGGAGQRWIQRGLVVGQVALAVLLLCASGLLLRSMVTLMKLDRGFDTTGLVEIRPLVSGSGRNAEQRAAVTRDLLDRFAALPGTTSATMSASGMGRRYLRDGKEDPVLMWETAVTVGTVDYFQTLRLRLKAGRWFGPEDDQKGARTVVLDADAAEAMWPGQSAIGKRFVQQGAKSSDKAAGEYEVIGVVETMRSLTLEQDTMFVRNVYTPFSRSAGLAREYYLRTTLAPPALKASVERICKEVLPGARQPMVLWIEERLHASIAPRRMMLWSALALAGTGLFLAMLGVFGVQLHAVTGRTKEIGIRMALGADRHSVTRMVLAQGMAVVGAGALLGLVAALGLSGAMGSLLYGIDTHDPLTFLAVPLLLAGVALLACWLPARRAAKVDPMVALRSE
jgi:predicted permease